MAANPPVAALRARARAPRGLTLVELMVALVIAFLVLGAVYALYEQGVATARLETQIAHAETQLRTGLDHVWRDVLRTGFRATANSEVDRLRNRICWMPPGLSVHGVSVGRNAGFVADPATNVNIEPSSLTLFGDLFTPRGHLFHSAAINTASSEVQLQADALLTSMSKEQFNELFRPGARWLRVMTDDAKEWYAPIEAVFYETLTIKLTATPALGVCQTGIGDYQDISPVGWVRYSLVEDTTTAALFGEGAEARMAGKTDLVREELNAAGAAVAGTQLVVAEYVVDFQLYDFVFDATALVGGTPVYEVDNFVTEVVDETGSAGRLARGDVGADPQNLRYFTVKLGVRTPDEDRSHPFAARASLFSRLTSFDVVPELVGSARVFSQAKRMELRNYYLQRQR